MKTKFPQNTPPILSTLDDLAKYADYSFMDTLKADSEAKENGIDHDPRQVFSGHYVPVKPTPISEVVYVAHSHQFFKELGFADSMAASADFERMFSGDLSQVPKPMRKVGWATGYALSIYGTEYYQQCPFQTGNGYGDGRAVSVLEVVINHQRWEMQLKGGGRTPYCRGADGRAVLRSSVREFLAQEHMHALGVPTSRSLSLFTSQTEKVHRPWYSEGSRSVDPDKMIAEPVAITTRVASSFIRVGQVELFGRRARKAEHGDAMKELEQIVLHIINREYADVIENSLSMAEKITLLAQSFRDRLISLVSHWIRVGFCQGNFNSDNCAVGGFTLDYGPFGFCDIFDPQFQPWTGGGNHFSFLNQPSAAERNFEMFCKALQPLLEHVSENPADAEQQLDEITTGFGALMQQAVGDTFAAKLGLEQIDPDLINELAMLMVQTSVDYTIFFRELSKIPEDIEPLKTSFYKDINDDMNARWSDWFNKWKSYILNTSRSIDEISKKMQLVNPKYTLREWLVAPAYQQAIVGDYSLLKELQSVMTQPYEEQSKTIEEKFYKLKPVEFSNLAGVSHMSCSS